mgnify:FL=1
MQNLLIVYHSHTGNTAQLAAAAYQGATQEAYPDLFVRLLQAQEATADDLLWANGLLVGTPENFGYMSGLIKDFFERTFYAVEGKLAPLPYAMFICAGNDGTGAVTSIERIARGYPLIPVQETLICRGPVDEQALADCNALGAALAAGLDLGIF